jgi:plastocyanin
MSYHHPMTNRTRRRAAAWFGLSLFAVTAIAAGLSSPGTARAASVSIAVENYDFAPASRTITAGDAVRWTFSGDQHSVTSRDGLFDSGIKDAGGSFQFTFTEAGTYRYYCVVHPDLMSGTIVVKAASATPTPTDRPTPKPTATSTPKPTAHATVKPTATPAPVPSPTPANAGPSDSPAPPASVAPSASASASQALIETPGPSSLTASPAPGPTEPANASDATPILAGGVLLAAIVVVGGWLLARRRRAT